MNLISHLVPLIGLTPCSLVPSAVSRDQIPGLSLALIVTHPQSAHLIGSQCHVSSFCASHWLATLDYPGMQRISCHFKAEMRHHDHTQANNEYAI